MVRAFITRVTKMSKGDNEVGSSCVKGKWKYLTALADPCVPPNPSIHLSGSLFSPGLPPLVHTDLSEETPSDKEECGTGWCGTKKSICCVAALAGAVTIGTQWGACLTKEEGVVNEIKAVTAASIDFSFRVFSCKNRGGKNRC